MGLAGVAVFFAFMALGRLLCRSHSRLSGLCCEERIADSSEIQSVAARARACNIVRIAIFYQDCGQADEIEVHGLGNAGGSEANAEGVALPGGFGASGHRGTTRGWSGRGPGADFLSQEGTAGANLGDDGIELVAAGVEAAVGGVVAKPDDLRDGRIVVWQLHGGDVAVAAIDHDPGAALPDPVLGLFTGERVVEAQRPADHEAAVSDVVDFARGPFFDFVIDYERADVEGL